MQLGRALLLAGDDEAAQEQFEVATDLNPFFDMVRADVGDAVQERGALKGRLRGTSAPSN